MEKTEKIVPQTSDSWILFKNIDFENESILQYHIDTRDFNCSISKEESTVFSVFNSLEKYPKRYAYSSLELMELLTRFYEKSGGSKSWRFLSLDGEGKNYSGGWQLKYIRIYRTKYGLVVCNRDSYCLRKLILNSKVSLEYL